MGAKVDWSKLAPWQDGCGLESCAAALSGRDVLCLSDLSSAELFYVLATALAQKQQWRAGVQKQDFCGQAVAVILEKPSLRTRISFEVAVARLGAQPLVMSDANSAFSRGESIKDTIMVLERFADVIVMRTFAQERIAEVAKWASVPVVNALTDDYHPCQGLADLLTMHEHKGALSALSVAYVGDGSNNMANTYMEAAALCGQKLRIAAPEQYQPDVKLFNRCAQLAEQNGGSIEPVRTRNEAVVGADVVITDTWASMGAESEHDERAEVFAPYQIDEAAMALAAPGAIFEHCLPAHRGEEVTDAVMDSAASVIYDEAENRLHAQKALLSCLLSAREVRR